MLHNQIASDLRSEFSSVSTTSSVISTGPAERSLRLARPTAPLPDTGGAGREPKQHRVLADVLCASAKRFSAFCAEASVLVFVLGILDRYLMKQRIEMGWVAGAFVMSVALLGLSVATDVAARRWLIAHRPARLAH